MTDEQTAQIEVLRMQGKGYKSIASAVGLTRDIVRNYCKANGMDGYGETAVLNMQKRLENRKELEKAFRINAERVDA